MMKNMRLVIGIGLLVGFLGVLLVVLEPQKSIDSVVSKTGNASSSSSPTVYYAKPAYIEINKKIISNLYHNITGFIKLSAEERACIEEGYTKKCSTYGEIPYDSLQVILDNEQLGPNDVVYDFGSGVGKVVMQVYLNTPVQKVVGLELSSSRHEGAMRMFEQFKQVSVFGTHNSNGKRKREIECKNVNFLEQDVSDATVIYMCSTCFAPELLEELVAKFERIGTLGLRIITLKELPHYQSHGFRLVRSYNLPMSWSKEGKKSPVYVYVYVGELFK